MPQTPRQFHCEGTQLRVPDGSSDLDLYELFGLDRTRARQA